MSNQKAILHIATAVLFVALAAGARTAAAARVYSVLTLDPPATPTFATDTAAVDAFATGTALPAQLTAAAVFYEGAIYDIPREQLELLPAGSDVTLLYRGKSVGGAAITQTGLFPCCEQALAGRAEAVLRESTGAVTSFLAVSGSPENATASFRASVTESAIQAYHNEFVRAGAVGLRKSGVAATSANKAQPAELAIVQPAPGAPLLVIGSLVVPRAVPECKDVYNDIACVRHALFMVARHDDKLLRPLIWSYADGDALAATGWENPVDVVDVDADGDADLITRTCDTAKCSFRIFTYHDGDFTLAFRGEPWAK